MSIRLGDFLVAFANQKGASALPSQIKAFTGPKGMMKQYTTNDLVPYRSNEQFSVLSIWVWGLSYKMIK